MIDLNNTWCLNTEENYNALEKLKIEFVGDYCKIDKYLVIQSCFSSYSEIKDKPWFSQINKQIHLINGEFQYVETKHRNNFKDYGFEADFEGEILKELDNCYIGWIMQHKTKKPIKWNKKGIWEYFELQEPQFPNGKYNLNPIKKEWFENPDNFPCLIKKDDWFMSICNNEDYQFYIKDGYTLATKEEVLSLLVKE